MMRKAKADVALTKRMDGKGKVMMDGVGIQIVAAT